MSSILAGIRTHTISKGTQVSETTTKVAPDVIVSNPARSRPDWLVASGVGFLAALVVGLFASAFLWPLSVSEPKDIPFGVAGPEQQLVQIEGQLTSQQEGLFDLTTYDDRDAVVRAIERREIDGGLVVSDTGMEMLTASAGNVQVTQLLSQMAAGMKDQQAAAAQQAIADAVSQAKEQGVPAEQILTIQESAQEKAAAVTVTVTDVVSGGAGAMASSLVMLPALIGGMITSVLSLFAVKRPSRRIISLISGSFFAGLAGALVLGPWFDILPGGLGATWLALSTGILAIAATITGLGTLLGKAGLGLGVILMMLIGNPWGGALVPSEFLGGFMGWLGAHMPNGNVIQLVKTISFFPEASQASRWWILIAWILIGLGLWAVGTAIHGAKAKKQLTSALEEGQR